MNNNKCKYHRIRSRKKQYYGYCIKYKKEVPLFCKCDEMELKEYPKSPVPNKKSPVLKQKTGKLAKLERNRFSIFTDDLDHCIICEKPKDNLHEVFFGTSRQHSMKYGLVIPLCVDCHREMHKNKSWQECWHKKGQTQFNIVYPNLDFLEIFKRNYL